MTLSRRGSRSIAVDGLVFRWLAKRRPTYCQALGSSPLTFVAELTGETGARLVEALHTHIPGTGSARQVRPATVAATISQAMSTGWQPCRPAQRLR